MTGPHLAVDSLSLSLWPCRAASRRSKGPLAHLLPWRRQAAAHPVKAADIGMVRVLPIAALTRNTGRRSTASCTGLDALNGARAPATGNFRYAPFRPAVFGAAPADGPTVGLTPALLP